MATVNDQTRANAKAEQANKVGGDEENGGHFVVSEENFGQRLSEQSRPQNIFNDHNPAILWIDQQPFEVKVVNKIYKSRVELRGGAYGV